MRAIAESLKLNVKAIETNREILETEPRLDSRKDLVCHAIRKVKASLVKRPAEAEVDAATA